MNVALDPILIFSGIILRTLKYERVLLELMEFFLVRGDECEGCRV